MTSQLITHGACGRSWFGIGKCHCAGCHRTFSSLTSFERHQRRDRCLHPLDVGLVGTLGIDGEVWHRPGLWEKVMPDGL